MAAAIHRPNVSTATSSVHTARAARSATASGSATAAAVTIAVAAHATPAVNAIADGGGSTGSLVEPAGSQRASQASPAIAHAPARRMPASTSDG